MAEHDRVTRLAGVIERLEQMPPSCSRDDALRVARERIVALRAEAATQTGGEREPPAARASG